VQARPNEIASRLAGGLAPVYIVSGDEPLQRDEILSLIRDAALAQGVDERVRLHAGTGFDWLELGQHNDMMSLFSDRRLIELTLATGKPGDAGGKALVRYCERINSDNVLVVSAPKLDPATKRSRWYKALDAAGITVQVWPIDVDRLPQWLRQRGTKHGLSLSGDAAGLLAERVEGNLLAADQELKKLALLHYTTGLKPAEIDVEKIMEAVGASSRYNVFDTIEAAVDGNAERTLKILSGLREEGVEPSLLAWALGRELRSLSRMKGLLEQGVRLDQVLDQERVWDKRKRPVTDTLSRLSGAQLRGAMIQLAKADRLVKGAEKGNAWDTLVQIALTITGTSVFTETA